MRTARNTNTLYVQNAELYSVSVTSRLTVYRQSVRLGDKPLETHNQHFFFQLASAIILGSKSHGTHTYLLTYLLMYGAEPFLRSCQLCPRDSWHYCLKFETLPTWRARSTYLYPPRTGWPNYTPRHGVPFRHYDSQGYSGGIRPRLHTGANFSILKQVVYIVITGL
jgi:hypothetical protein